MMTKYTLPLLTTIIVILLALFAFEIFAYVNRPAQITKGLQTYFDQNTFEIYEN